MCVSKSANWPFLRTFEVAQTVSAQASRFATSVSMDCAAGEELIGDSRGYLSDLAVAAVEVGEATQLHQPGGITLSISSLSTARDRRRRGRRGAKKTHGLCEVTGKRRYRDGDDAGLALRNLKRRRASIDLEGGTHTLHVTRKYACEWCDGWHLTSQPSGLVAADVQVAA